MSRRVSCGKLNTPTAVPVTAIEKARDRRLLKYDWTETLLVMNRHPIPAPARKNKKKRFNKATSVPVVRIEKAYAVQWSSRPNMWQLWDTTINVPNLDVVCVCFAPSSAKAVFSFAFTLPVLPNLINLRKAPSTQRWLNLEGHATRTWTLDMYPLHRPQTDNTAKKLCTVVLS